MKSRLFNRLVLVGQKALSKVEARVRQLESDFMSEQRKHQESIKNLSRQDKRVREMAFQVSLLLLQLIDLTRKISVQ